MERGWPDEPPSSAYERRRKPSDRSIDRVTQDIKETQSLTGDAWIRHGSLVNVDNSPSENKRKNPLPTWLCKNKRGVTGYLCLAFGRSPRIPFGSIRAYSCGQYVRKLRWTDPVGVRLGLLAVRACVDDIHRQCDKRDATEDGMFSCKVCPGRPRPSWGWDVNQVWRSSSNSSSSSSSGLEGVPKSLRQTGRKIEAADVQGHGHVLAVRRDDRLTWMNHRCLRAYVNGCCVCGLLAFT